MKNKDIGDASYQNMEVYEVKTGVQRLRWGYTKKTDPNFLKP